MANTRKLTKTLDCFTSSLNLCVSVFKCIPTKITDRHIKLINHIWSSAKSSYGRWMIDSICMMNKCTKYLQYVAKPAHYCLEQL